MLRGTGQWQGNRTPDNQAANKLVDAGGIWFEDVGSTPTASMFIIFGYDFINRSEISSVVRQDCGHQAKCRGRSSKTSHPSCSITCWSCF